MVPELNNETQLEDFVFPHAFIWEKKRVESNDIFIESSM